MSIIIMSFPSLAEVLHQSKQLPGSPFTCESFDPSRVTVQGLPRGSISVHHPVSFSGKLSRVK